MKKKRTFAQPPGGEDVEFRFFSENVTILHGMKIRNIFYGDRKINGKVVQLCDRKIGV